MKRFIIPILDILLAVYLALAVTSFNKPDTTTQRCTKVHIDIADQSTFGFLHKEEIENILKKRNVYPLNKLLIDVQPRELEELLRHSAFVKTAEVYKTKDGHVNVIITQRTPVIRIKNAIGQDYYIDENGGVMPNSKYTSDLIVATGHITQQWARDYLSILANTIMANDLWRNQIEQINILKDCGVEIVPRVGEHIVFLGYLPESKSRAERQQEIPEFVNKQFERLLKFYRYGLSQAGWNRYEYIDLQYSNQVICRKTGAEMARLAAEKEAKCQQELKEAALKAQQQQEHALQTAHDGQAATPAQ